LLTGNYKTFRLVTVFMYTAFFFIISSCNSSPGFRYSEKERQKQTLIIQPFAEKADVPYKLITSSITRQYGFKVSINPHLQLAEKFENHEKGKRYSAPMLLDYLNKLKPDSAALITGITGGDIYTTKKDRSGKIKKPEYKYKIWGIFGLATCPGSSSVISTKRIKHPDRSKYEDRVIKIILHEIGHNLGLKHCTNKKCLMTDAVETINTIDNASSSLCKKCVIQIGH